MGSWHAGTKTRDSQVGEYPHVKDRDAGLETGGRPGEQMKSCGSYGGDYSSWKGKVRYITIYDRV